MNILGISAGFHDAAISVIDNYGSILFAGHSERYSKKKHDLHIGPTLLTEALSYGFPDVIAYYEKPLLKKLRQLYAGQYADALNMNDWSVKRYLKAHCPTIPMSNNSKVMNFGHHLSHAAAGFQTSPFDRATVVVIDAIGELDTISIYGAQYNAKTNKAEYTKLWSRKYPHSIGLFYSAMTHRVGLRPLDEEYILMGMAAYGTPEHTREIRRALVDSSDHLLFKENLHTGLPKDFLPCPSGLSEEQHNYNIAASAQAVVESMITDVMLIAALLKWSDNLVYSGGVALNCTANRLLGNYFENIWIMPNPGDAGSSLGAAALAYGKRLNWEGPYLGTNIPGEYPVHSVVTELKKNKIVGVASGRAEFGPRALGNRSLLADPTGAEIKDKVNEIKRRQKFRPFAPIILEEHAHRYFEMPKGFSTSPYMQVTAKCKLPELYPAIVHADGTSRVQTVPKDSKSGVRQLLEAWNTKTGCPMLLNTSLNIRGEPMVDDRDDADRFEDRYNVKVCS